MRTRFDQFAKQMTQAALGRAGTVHTDQEVSPDAGHVDIWFTPANHDATESLAVLGMLGRIGRTACTLEPFHRTPDGLEATGCVVKHYHFRAWLSRRSPSQALPLQWILSAGRPETAIDGLGFQPSPEWGDGVYRAPPLLYTQLVVVAELPERRDTLLLRLMGAGRVLLRAVAELKALDQGAFERALALPILLRLRLDIPAEPMKRTQDDEEFAVSTQDIVETYLQQFRQQGREEGRQQGREEGRQEGRQEGRDEGFAEALITLYTERFGAPPAEIAAEIAHTRDHARLLSWLKLAARGTVEEVHSAIRGQAAS